MSPQFKSKKIDIMINKIGNFRPVSQYSSPKNNKLSPQKRRPRTAKRIGNEK